MNEKWSLVLTGIAFALTGCGGPVDGDGAEEAIAVDSSALKNGTLVNQNSLWKGAVKLQIFSPALNAYQTCSGQVVARSTIVTAAHCVAVAFDRSTTSGYVTAIINRETASGQWLTVMSKRGAFAKYHPSYNGSAFHDVGIVTSDEPFTNVTSTDAVAIALDAPSGQVMWAAGYGPYDVNADDGQGRAAALVPVYSSSNHEYTFMATASSDPWLCKGDSGGPLKMTNGSWRLYGVASFFQTKVVSNPPPLCGSLGHWASMLDNNAWLEAAVGYDKCVHGSTSIVCW